MNKAEIEIGTLTETGLPAKPEVGRMAPDTNDDAIKVLVGKKPL